MKTEMLKESNNMNMKACSLPAEMSFIITFDAGVDVEASFDQTAQMNN